MELVTIVKATTGVEQFSDKRILVLGASGLVGRAICRRLLRREPSHLVVTALREREIEKLREDLQEVADEASTEMAAEWGDVFVRTTMKDQPRGETLADPSDRRTFLHDLYGHLDDRILSSSFLYGLFERYEPDIVIDCINAATALAYQDVYQTVSDLRDEVDALRKSDGGEGVEEVAERAERLMASQYIPQLIRHVQILRRAMQEVDTETYLKVGTTGTGGMGLNIPFTHSEERPSRLLLSKSSVAGAHTMLLFLLGRTPGAPAIKEVKPAAAIGWKDIDHGEIRRGGEVVELYDCPPDRAESLDQGFEEGDGAPWERVGDRRLQSVYVDAGENGYLALGEFAVLSNEGLMEFVTPEETANRAIAEVAGANTGNDVVAALDSAVIDPSYRAGMLRERALTEMEHLERRHETKSIAFELLGPPRLAKLLFESHLLDRATPALVELPDAEPDEIASRLEEMVRDHDRLRQEIISTGTGILLSDGDRLLRGPNMNNPDERERRSTEPSPRRVDRWAEEGWVDLRAENVERWQRRIADLVEWRERRSSPHYSSASALRETYGLGEETRALGRLVSWVLADEEEGSRLK